MCMMHQYYLTISNDKNNFIFCRISKGLCVSPGSIKNKLASWINKLDEEIIQLRKEWAEGGQTKYQLVGDNWDKNIIPAFR